MESPATLRDHSQGIFLTRREERTRRRDSGNGVMAKALTEPALHASGRSDVFKLQQENRGEYAQMTTREARRLHAR